MNYLRFKARLMFRARVRVWGMGLDLRQESKFKDYEKT
jgi:hypothetical protein